jgi:hypothetical protein
MNTGRVQVPVCPRCSVGVMDVDNPHLTGQCACGCHRRMTGGTTGTSNAPLRVVHVFHTGQCARVEYADVTFHVDLATGVVGWMSDWSRAAEITTVRWTGFGVWANPDSLLLPELLDRVRARVGGDR